MKRVKLTTGTDHTTCPFRLTEGTGMGSLWVELSSESSVVPLLDALDSSIGDIFGLIFLTQIVLNGCFDAEGFNWWLLWTLNLKIEGIYVWCSITRGFKGLSQLTKIASPF